MQKHGSGFGRLPSCCLGPMGITLDVAILTLTGFALLGLGTAQDAVACPTNLQSSVTNDTEASLGGRVAMPGRYPYMVSLHNRLTRSHFCTRVLVDVDLVLTAAQCVDPTNAAVATFPQLYIGGIGSGADADTEEHEACSTLIHAQYGNVTDGYDIALIRLRRPSNKTPVKLLYGSIAGNQDTRSVGWVDGLDGNTGVLHEVDLAVPAAEKCSEELNAECEGCAINILPQMVCGQSPGRNACPGGVGWPLLVPVDGIEATPSCGSDDILGGILSFAFKCSDEENRGHKLPAVYTNVSEFTSWIQSTGDGLENRILKNPDIPDADAEFCYFV